MDQWHVGNISYDSGSPLPDQPSASSAEAVRRSRASKPKVKTGCWTCKLRRVKCDESKPACKRCLQTGRKCGGYAKPKERKETDRDAAMKIMLRKGPDFHTGSPPETSALEYFYVQVGPELAGYFEADFWTRLVFQVGNSENAIRHAFIALGSLARQQGKQVQQVSDVQVVAVRDTDHTPDGRTIQLPLVRKNEATDEQFALMHYNKAIAELASRMGEPDFPVEVVLLACILFVCVEFLRGNLQPALRHFRSGMRVTLAALARKYAIGPEIIQRVRQNMIPFFSRLELVSGALGNEAEWDYIVPLEESMPKILRSIRQARESLIHLMNHITRLGRRNKLRRYMNAVSHDDMMLQEAINKQMHKWQQAFDDLLLSESVTAVELDDARMLQLYHIILNTWCNIALTVAESKCDEWIQDYERAVSLAEVIQSSASTTQRSSPSFLFDMSVVAPLYLVIVRCRHPQTRRRATSTLKRMSTSEGLWDAQMAAVLGERLMAFEEKNLNTLDGTELPCEEDRIHASHINEMKGLHAEYQGYEIVHYYRPYGLQGPWRMFREEVLVSASS